VSFKGENISWLWSEKRAHEMGCGTLLLVLRGKGLHARRERGPHIPRSEVHQKNLQKPPRLLCHLTMPSTRIPSTVPDSQQGHGGQGPTTTWNRTLPTLE